MTDQATHLGGSMLRTFTVAWSDQVMTSAPEDAATTASRRLMSQRERFFTVTDEDGNSTHHAIERYVPIDDGDLAEMVIDAANRLGSIGIMADGATDRDLTEAWAAISQVVDNLSILRTCIEKEAKQRIDASGAPLPFRDNVVLRSERSQEWGNCDHAKVRQLVAEQVMRVDRRTGETLDKEDAVNDAIRIMTALYVPASATPKVGTLKEMGVAPNDVMKRLPASQGRGWKLALVANITRPQQPPKDDDDAG